VKTRSDLLLRDALAEIFVSAVEGNATARKALEELASWSSGSPAGPTLQRLLAEDGSTLFASDGSLSKKFSGLRDYAHDRARRFAAALAWIHEENANNPIACARAAWDAGLFFEVHELLESVWMGSQGKRRRLLQGLIMAGAALHHLTQANPAGARGLLRDAAQRLAEAPPNEPFDLVSFGRELDELADLIERGQVEHITQVQKLPRILLRPSR